MKKYIFWSLITLLVGAFGCSKVQKSQPVEMASAVEQAADESFYQFSMAGLDGGQVDFSQYKGKKVLLVNVASKCGYTPQYEGLQQLHEQYGQKVVVLGFPANNFMGQEPGSNEQIAAFCQKNYGVSFQMFEKISVKGKDQHPLYQWLSTKEQNGWNDQAPTWNFCKYLVDEEGQLKHFFNSKVEPMGDELLAAIAE